MHIELDPQDKRALRELAEEVGKDPGELLRELVHKALEDEKRNGPTPREREEESAESAYDVALRTGIIGMVDDLPADHRTNPRTWESFGRECHAPP